VSLCFVSKLPLLVVLVVLVGRVLAELEVPLLCVPRREGALKLPAVAAAVVAAVVRDDGTEGLLVRAGSPAPKPVRMADVVPVLLLPLLLLLRADRDLVAGAGCVTVAVAAIAFRPAPPAGHE
jgi:hypothetical protein